jgi:hypothetical protein
MMRGGRIRRGVMVASTGTHCSSAGGSSRRRRTCGAVMVVMADTIVVDGLFGLVRFMTRVRTLKPGHEGRARCARGGSA